MVEIEKFLLRVYEAQHYDFKSFRDKSKHTIYDLDISRAVSDKLLLEAQEKKDKQTFENLCKKLEETIQEQRKNGFVEGEVNESTSEEEDEEENMYGVQKDVHVQKNGKDSKKQAKELAKQRQILKAQLEHTVKSTQSSMATVQERLMGYQTTLEMLEKKKEYYEHYRSASWYYQEATRKLVLEYEQTKNLEALVKGFQDIFSYYTKLRRRYVSIDSCKGSGKMLCETHLLPLHVSKTSEKGEPIAWQCNLYLSSCV